MYRKAYGSGAAYNAQMGPPGRGTELKSVDSHLDVGFGITDGNILEIGLPIQNPTFYGRIANRTRGVSLELRGLIQTTAANGTEVPNQIGRILVVYDRQPNGAIPASSDILQDFAYDGSTSSTNLSKLNMVNRDRFLILRDRPMWFKAIGADGIADATADPFSVVNDPNTSSVPGFVYNEHIELKGLQTQYRASSTGGIGDISTGAFYLLCMDTTVSGNSAFKLEVRCRYKYYD